MLIALHYPGAIAMVKAIRMVLLQGLLPKSGAPIPAAVPRETEELEEDGGCAALRSNSAILFFAWVNDVLVALLSGSSSSACRRNNFGWKTIERRCESADLRFSSDVY